MTVIPRGVVSSPILLSVDDMSKLGQMQIMGQEPTWKDILLNTMQDLPALLKDENTGMYFYPIFVFLKILKITLSLFFFQFILKNQHGL